MKMWHKKYGGGEIDIKSLKRVSWEYDTWLITAGLIPVGKIQHWPPRGRRSRRCFGHVRCNAGAYQEIGNCFKNRYDCLEVIINELLSEGWEEL